MTDINDSEPNDYEFRKNFHSCLKEKVYSMAGESWGDILYDKYLPGGAFATTEETEEGIEKLSEVLKRMGGEIYENQLIPYSTIINSRKKQD
jgi:hypothetical protein